MDGSAFNEPTSPCQASTAEDTKSTMPSKSVVLNPNSAPCCSGTPIPFQRNIPLLNGKSNPNPVDIKIILSPFNQVGGPRSSQRVKKNPSTTNQETDGTSSGIENDSEEEQGNENSEQNQEEEEKLARGLKNESESAQEGPSDRDQSGGCYPLRKSAVLNIFSARCESSEEDLEMSTTAKTPIVADPTGNGIFPAMPVKAFHHLNQNIQFEAHVDTRKSQKDLYCSKCSLNNCLYHGILEKPFTQPTKKREKLGTLPKARIEPPEERRQRITVAQNLAKKAINLKFVRLFSQCYGNKRSAGTPPNISINQIF